METNSKFHLMEFTKLDKYVNNPSTCSTIKAVFDMIDSGFADPYYALSKSNIAIDESIHSEVFLKLNAYDCTALMTKDSCRFFYFEDVKDMNHTDYGFNKLLFSTKSNINESAVNNHCTYFISRDVKDNKDFTTALIVSIIQNKMNRYLETEYGIEIERGANKEGILLPENFYGSSTLSYVKFLVQYKTTLYSTLDRCLGLKYADWDNINKACTNLMYGDIVSLYDKDIYNNAISTPRTDADDNDLFKNIYSHIIYN